MPQCDSCQVNCDSWQELAQHILQYRYRGHEKGVKWAQAFLTKAKILNQKRDLPQRIALTEEQRDAKESCQRELSGLSMSVRVQCPMCTTPFQARLEQEFVSNPQAWKNQNTLLVLCDSCRR